MIGATCQGGCQSALLILINQIALWIENPPDDHTKLAGCSPRRMSARGLGRVKTPTFNQRIEIPSRFRQFENQKCLRLLLGEDDRENNSAHFWRVHVFTQPGSISDLSERLGEVRSSPNNGHVTTASACLKSADIVAKVPKGAAANFPPKNKTSDNRRSIGLQTRYQNRL
jgi:hypothetical protein